MQTFENCICIAQARVIAGFKRESHICTIAYQPSEERFLRLCVPFRPNRSPLVKRWTRFDFTGSKETLPSNDTRQESWDVSSITRKNAVLTKKEKDQLHCKILSLYKYQDELNDEKESIGIFVPVPRSLQFSREELSPYKPDEKRALERNEYVMKTSGVWIPSYTVRVKGKWMRDGKLRSFNKQLLSWDVYETLRKGEVNPFAAIHGFRNPYFIIGNTAPNRTAWMVISVLSAPDGAIERFALNQQMAWC